ncbi:basic-leucine zipper transcription factor family protein [Striga asiatica]|uniref:Basic-leucine zipper transcription factor family protein n=1 Tax=Striga asiatica TaxID=4170 RepID=A0A5A7PYG3_STRAF|nr:basic-leucine zipper transcription factor family protein [Striga asiatica]
MNEGVEVEGFGRGEGERSMSLSEPLDKAEQWRQRRMSKNRESATKSSERKQAYQVELESILFGISSGLGVDGGEITRRKGAVSDRKKGHDDKILELNYTVFSNPLAEQTKKRLKQLMENVIPVVDKRRENHHACAGFDPYKGETLLASRIY